MKKKLRSLSDYLREWSHEGFLFLLSLNILVVISMGIITKVEFGEFDRLFDLTSNLEAEYYELLEAVEEEEDYLLYLENEYDELEAEYSQDKEKLEEALALSEKKEEMREEVSTLESERDSLKEEVSKDREVVKKLESEPIIVGAGQYDVGSDIEANRYEISNVGRGSNLFVRDIIGSSKVNTILGDNGVGSYIVELEDGDTLQTEAKISLKEIE